MLLMTILILAACSTPAQVSTAELSGSVLDPTGAAIAAARITVSNTATGLSRETTSAADSSYLVPLLPPGSYRITVEAAGFRKLVRDGVTLQVNQRARVDLTLELGQTTETLQVTGAPPLIESQSSSLGSVISERFVNQLPLNGRNFVQLAILSPGVSGVGYNTTGTIMSGARPDDRRPGTEVFSNGNREGSNNFLYDGVDNNDRYTLSIVLRPAVEAVREFKVQTNLYSADLGRNSGAVVDVVTKSGTNQLHGSLFEFLRNSAMDARNYYNVRGTPFPAFRFNQFGFSLGGPVLLPRLHDGRNRTFFFVDYEGYRRDSLQSFQTTVPTLAIRRGDFSAESRIFDPLTTRPSANTFVRDQFPGNQIPASRFDVPMVKLINAYPDPQNSARFTNYLVNSTLRQNWNQGDVRIDHQFTPNDTFFARWSVQHTSTITPTTFPATQIPGLPKPVGLSNEDSFAGTSFQPVQHAAASYVHVFSPRLIGEFRAGFNRFVMDYITEGSEPGANFGNALGIPNSNTSALQSSLPVVSPANYAGAGASRTSPILRFINTFHYTGNVTFTSGRHTLKFGGDLRRRQLTDYGINRGAGRLNFSPGFTNLPGTGGTGNSMASFLLGYPSLIEKDWLLAWVGVRALESGLYFADDLRINRRLTLNLGLRREYYSPFSEVADRWAFFDADTAVVNVAGRDGVDRRVNVQRNLRDLAPRFGFAFQVLPKTVLRGGYGLFYNPSGALNSAIRGHRHTPFGPIYSITPGDINLGPRASGGFPAEPQLDLNSARNPAGVVFGVFPRFRSSYAQQFNLMLQQELSRLQTVVKLAYVGNLGRRLATVLDLNQPVPGPTSVASRRRYFALRPGLTNVNYALSDGLSSYHAFQLTVDKRLSGGLGFMIGYAWQHAIENVGTEYGGGSGAPQDIRNRAADRANAAYDLRHRMTVSYLYSLPSRKGRAFLLLGGWQTNGIATFQTGLPFTPMLQNATTNCCASRPDRRSSGALASSQRTLARWFDPTAFATPPLYTFGNAGRNILYGPGRVNFDLSLFKTFTLRERVSLQFRTEAFNVFNTPQFNLPNASIGNPQAGVISSTVGTPRQMQLALRLEF